MTTNITVVAVPPAPIAVLPMGYGLQGAPGEVAISTDPENRLRRGTDAGLLVPEIVADPLAYYILAKA
ncbi:MAG: hypothetical protein EAZ30_00020 [Betaproteobacteria bacterium]|nr:MAG: hypothetical protein EAZ30_00020 [Betaproteobacteria bacterium]